MRNRSAFDDGRSLKSNERTPFYVPVGLGLGVGEGVGVGLSVGVCSGAAYVVNSVPLTGVPVGAAM